jgi:hypothetical protein
MSPRKARKSLAPKRGSSKVDHGSDDGDDDEIEPATFAPQPTRPPVSRRPPTVSGKTRIVVSKGGPPKSRAEGKRQSEAPTMPPPPLDRPAASRMAETPKAGAGKPAKRSPTIGAVVEEVTANLSKDPRRDE